MGWPMGPGPGFVHTPADVTSVAKVGIQLKLDNIKCPCKIEDHSEVGRHFVLFSDLVAPCTSLCVKVHFIITIF